MSWISEVDRPPCSSAPRADTVMVELGETVWTWPCRRTRAGVPRRRSQTSHDSGSWLSQEARRLFSGTRQGPGGVLVVDDSTIFCPACDQCVRDVQLPAQTLFGVLLVSSRGPGVCHQRREGCTLITRRSPHLGLVRLTRFPFDVAPRKLHEELARAGVTTKSSDRARARLGIIDGHGAVRTSQAWQATIQRGWSQRRDHHRTSLAKSLHGPVSPDAGTLVAVNVGSRSSVSTWPEV